MIGKYLLGVLSSILLLTFINAAVSVGYGSPDDTVQNVNIYVGDTMNLTDLQDVEASSPTDNYVLTWNETGGYWEPRSAASVGDTNESVRVNNIVGTDCSAGNYSYGFDTNGNILCRDDLIGSGSGADGNASSICSGDEVLLGNGSCMTITNIGTSNNSWNQSYAETLFAKNTTGAIQQLINMTVVLFQQVLAVDWSNVTITESQITDLTHTVDTSAYVNCSGDNVFLGNGSCQSISTFGGADTNESVRFENLVTTDCSGTDKVIGVYSNGTVVCAADQIGAADGNASSICNDGEYLDGSGACINFNNTVDLRDDDTTYSNGSGLTLVGTEFSHADTSNQASSDNSGNTFIQDIIIDTFGHITSIVTATVDFTNYYLKTEVYNKTEIDTQGEMETIWGVTLATDAELAAQDECSEITGCVVNAITSTNVAYINESNTFTENQTMEGIILEKNTTDHHIYDNASCIIIEGSTSTMYIC